MRRLFFLVSFALVAPSLVAAPVDFATEVKPIFAKACVSCHGAEKPKGALRLDRRAEALKGGDSGAAIAPGKPEASLLLKLVSGGDPDLRMPPDGKKPLTAVEIATLRRWIAEGANWPDDGSTVADPRDWWSLKPLAKPPIPDAKASNPVDAFVRAKLREKGLTPSAEADRRTLIRRVYFDVTGLPPTPDEIDAFVADPAPDAYEKLIDRLLASPRYGERWARHWLDVVHYGESHGYDKDKPRPNAWPYRDYIIRSLNADKPYDRFVREQIAGDVLYPGTPDGIEALGFIAAGPWDFIGHAEVPESKIDGKIARHLDRDDMIANTVGTFLSLTVHCAQCHNHKFDPIPTEDYYRLQAVFAALDRADKAYDADPAVSAKRLALQKVLKDAQVKLDALNADIVKRGGKELADLDHRLADAGKDGSTNTRPEFGYHSAIAAKPDAAKWVQVDLGRPRAVSTVVLRPCYDDFNSIGAGFGFPRRFKVELSNDAEFKRDVFVIADHTTADVPNPGTASQRFALTATTGRYLRVTATVLAPRQNDFIFALAELEAHDADGANLAKGAAVTALDSIEAPVRWGRKNLTDGIAPTEPKLPAAELAAMRKKRDELWDRTVGKEGAKAIADLRSTIAKTEADLRILPAPKLVYAGMVHTGGGTFVGTGASGGSPRAIHVLPRGDVTKPGKAVSPGALTALPTLSPNFDLPAAHAEGERRAALAKWLTDPKNPLVWRSIVNRVWLYHFGRGLVDTPNDFGRMGQLPSHPELLDWLAADFRDNGMSLKRLHRLLLTSATYKQSSTTNAAFEKQDVDNQYYWRANRRKLEAEAVRDSILAVSGKLDLTMGGPSFMDFKIERPEHSPHYQYHLHDADDPASHRRSVYRFIVRSKPQPWLASLDCADPSQAVDKRNQTITPQQGLALLNSQLTVVMAKHFAARAEKLGNDPTTRAAAAFRLATGRAPTAAESTALGAYAATHGLANTCRVILNLNEFAFVD